MGVPLVGCASHRLNLAVQADMEEICQATAKTPLRPVIRQDTRWPSTFSMLKLYFELLEHLDMNDDTRVEYLPPPAANRRLRALLKELKLKKVESVAKALEGAEVTLLDVRVWFDGLLTIKPQYERYIGKSPLPDRPQPDFEAACVRVLGGDTGRLKRAERAAVEPFRHRQAEAAGEA
ncbi:hypothetical protein L915_01968 [Phytophthora nicotianae]|uniref:Uncharacterized protein n=1 Tax=Phytophthora nicotianae TaxID=4792 RepID=W2HIH1_PHYNI|nr:hypothetical protein L915_01968 [Phytophthora nicotianae]